MLRATAHGAITRIELARTVLGRPLFTVSAYLLDDTMIDSGPPCTAGELLEWCRGRAIARIINTHYHEDHSGGDALLADALGVRVLASAASLPRLARFEPLPPYRRFVWGRPRDVRAEALGDEVSVGARRLRVIPTPGHSTDHVCLFEPEERLLFGGDLFISSRARYLRRVEDVGQILASLERVRDLHPRLLLCSHAGVVEDAETVLTAKIDFLQRLGERAWQLHERGLSAPAIARRLLGGEGLMRWASLGDFSKRNLIESLLRSPRC